MAQSDEQQELDGASGSPSGEAQPPQSPPEDVAPGEVLVESLAESQEESRLLTEETLLPVTGMVRLSRRELEVIDHPAFQRLFEIYQLGQTHLVYRGATHTRGAHAIGTLEEATKLAAATQRNAARGPVEVTEYWQHADSLSEVEIAFVRLAALLHDVGHLPAGHTIEDELGLLPHHDADERISTVLDQTEWHGRSYAPLRELIDEKYAGEAAQGDQRDARGRLLSASELLLRLVSRDHNDVTGTHGRVRIGVCRDLVGNTICADLLDYLHRDLLHLGKPRFFDPRLLEYLEVLTREHDGEREDRLAINLRGGARPRPDAVTAILDLLETRYQLAEIALYHRVKNSASGMLERAIAEYRDSLPEREQSAALSMLTPQLLQCSDVEMLSLFEGELLARRTSRNGQRIDGAVDLLRRLRVRDLHVDLHILYAEDIGGAEAARVIAERFCGNPKETDASARDGLRAAAGRRLAALRTLEEDFDLPPGSIVMYCPSPEMNTKLAQVGILYKGVIDSLANLDETGGGHLTGGHLAAQQERFRRLWRISFAIEATVGERLKELGLLEPMRRTIKDAVLWQPPWDETLAADAVRPIAQDLLQLEGSPWKGRRLREPAFNREQADIEYPGGAPSIRSFIEEQAKAKRAKS